MKIKYRLLLILLIPLLIYTIIRLYLNSRYFIYGDEAEYMDNAWRVYMGGVPYKDFWLLFSPAEVYFPAFVFHLFGVHLGFIQIGNILTTLIDALLFFLILKELKLPVIYALIASLCLVIHGEYFFFASLCLTSCYFLLKYDSTGKKYFLYICGLAAGTALLFRVYQVAPYCIAACFFLSIRTNTPAQKIKDCLSLIAGALIPIIITVIALHNIIGTMFYAVMVDAVSHGTSLQIPFWSLMTDDWNKLFIYHNFSILHSNEYPARGIVFMFSGFLSDLFIRVAPFIIAICFLYDWITNSFNEVRKRKLFFIVWGILYLPYALNLSGNDHIVHTFMPFLILVYLYIYEKVFIEKGVALKILMIITLAIILFTSTLKLYQIYHPTTTKNYKLETATATLNFNDEKSYNTFNDITNTIFSNTSKGDYIFSLCWKAPPFYALTERQDPTYYDSPIDLILRPAQWKEESVITDLKRTRTKMVIVETNFSLIRDIDANTAKILPTFMSYVNQNYKLIKHYALYDVYLLK